MASLDGFDASKVEPNEGFDLLPAGDYTAVIVASDRKRTANGNGEYLKFELQVTDNGKHQNRKLWDNLNIASSGPNKETTEKIAKGTLSAICRAVGVLTPKDTSDLHMKPMKITVGVRKREDTGEMQNSIKGYKPRTSGPFSAIVAAVSPESALASRTPF